MSLKNTPGSNLPAAAANISVCLLAPHTLVLAQFKQVLNGTGFQVQARRIDPRLRPETWGATIPCATAYVLDVEGRGNEATSLAAAVLDRFPTARLLALAEAFTDRLSFDLLCVGAKGVLRYLDVETQLVPALTAVAAGGLWMPRDLVSRFLDSIIPSLRKSRLRTHARDMLSRREWEVREALLENLSNKEIASKLHISERTVKFHVSNLLAKFNVRSRSELILLTLNRSGA